MDYTTLGCLLPRYFRILGDASRDLSTVKVGSCSVRRVQWAPDFYAIPGCLPLHDSSDSVKSHIENGLYPMDIASAIAVMVLGLSADSRTSVLDLCCCPGSKLGLIAERLSPESIVVGVDISESRLNVCKSLLRTWSEPLTRFQQKESARQLIFHGDGTSFCDTSTRRLVFDSSIIKEEIAMFGGVKKRNKSYIKREQKRLKALESSMCGEPAVAENNVDRILPSSYNYVLVDAECTHDASYKHMQFIPANSDGDAESDADREHEQLTTAKSIGRKRPHDKPQASLSHGTDTTDNVSSDALRELQRLLLLNGFRNLKPGGVLVYSTCSQAREQNEDIVQWFLQTVKEEGELVSVLDTLRDMLPALSTAPAVSMDTSVSSADEIEAFGTAEFRFPLGAASNSTTCPLRLLQQDLPALMHTVQTQFPTEEARRALSFAICDAVTAQARPVVAESELLPGTVRLSYKGG
eukprot:CAMPEP_0185007226 /NCGR_PEP_ID=MMETSP1098-20130426/86543_1 /TAXON_ID=89044 /ORGANISM="Spumella elongata, Strain CCAP 955/1" /LENGTH=465 /DNA_ID=CAMNT_0027535531 /DNA_START=1 /DNA_END=1394 /DNA_ORIENTATION=+